MTINNTLKWWRHICTYNTRTNIIPRDANRQWIRNFMAIAKVKYTAESIEAMKSTDIKRYVMAECKYWMFPAIWTIFFSVWAVFLSILMEKPRFNTHDNLYHDNNTYAMKLLNVQIHWTKKLNVINLWLFPHPSNGSCLLPMALVPFFNDSCPLF